MNNRVTLLQAKRLRKLGYNLPCSTYHCASGNQIKVDRPMNWNAEKRKYWYDYSGEHQCTSIPKCNDVIDWIREKYSIVIMVLTCAGIMSYNKIICFEAFALYSNKGKDKFLYPKRKLYKDIFAAKRDIITKCLTHIESLSK